MQTILIDTHKRPIGSVIITNGDALKVLNVTEYKHWYSHSVWRFIPGQIVKWIHKTARNGGIEMKEYKGTLSRIINDNATVERRGKRYNIPLYQLFPENTKPLYDFLKAQVQ